MKKKLEEEYVIQFIVMQKLMINIWKIKNKESSYLKYLDVNGLYGWPISQKLPVNDFVLIEENVQKVEKSLNLIKILP